MIRNVISAAHFLISEFQEKLLKLLNLICIYKIRENMVQFCGNKSRSISVAAVCRCFSK